MGELGQLCEMCFLFSDQNTVVITWRHTTHTTGTRVGIHTCACSRVKGSLREQERACALNAWRAIPLILHLAIHLLPPSCNPSYFQSPPSLNGFILWSSRNVEVLPLLLPSLGLRWKTISPLSSANSLAPSFDNLQHWWFKRIYYVALLIRNGGEKK